MKLQKRSEDADKNLSIYTIFEKRAFGLWESRIDLPAGRTNGAAVDKYISEEERKR